MSLSTALELIDSIEDYKVLFVGDTIQDEYHYVTPLGKSPKENLIPVLHHSSEIFQGGVLAAAGHLQTFCNSVRILTDSNEVRKVRMIDQRELRKLFEIHYNGHIQPVKEQSLQDFDCVVVTDFGHGCINSESVKWLLKAPYLSVNAQTNSSNIGFNLITKYPKADYIVIDDPEARLAACDRTSPIETVMRALSKDRCAKMIVTHGFHGAYGFDSQRDVFTSLPSFNERAIDTMGAGDAFISITAPLSKRGSIEDLLLIGNAAGALKCRITGHRNSITKTSLIEFLRTHDPS